jgi:uncharacterized membrane protein YbhN (UPF0104 family)
MWVYERFNVRAWNRDGVQSYLAGRAGLLLPAQLGRLIRPDSMAQLGRGRLSRCLKAEVIAFVLDATSVGALLAGLLAAHFVSVWLMPPAVLGTIATLLFFGNRITRFLARTRLALPPRFWWRWETLAIVIVQMAGWTAHGVGFYFMLRGLAAGMSLWEPVFYAPASAVLGVATGLPGGLGATETFLGVSLEMMHIPAVHLALAVGAFRLVTFWVWIPIGWAALLAVRYRASRAESGPQRPVRGDRTIPVTE